MKKIVYLIILLIVAVTTAKAQLGFGTSNPASTSVVDITATNKGILLPRVALTGLTDVTTIPSAANALTVFNTATTTLHTANDVTPGYYYWNGTQWVRLLAATDAATNWTLKGNSGTSPLVNFLGTIDNQPLVFGTNNTEHLRLTQTGRLVFSNTTGGANQQNLFINGGTETTTGSRNIAFGLLSLSSVTSGSANLAIGPAALQANIQGSNNISLGYTSLKINLTGNDNVAVGQASLLNNSAGNFNVAMGTRALQSSNSNNNVGIGYNALGYTTSGTNNTAIGYQAGYGTGGNTTGSNNILIGANTVFPTQTASNQLNIANNIFGTGLTGTGFAPAGSIGISTATPNSTLQVAGSFSLPIKTVTGNYTVTASDYKIITNSSAVVTITLPDPAMCQGRMYVIQNFDATSSPAGVKFSAAISLSHGLTIAVGTATLTTTNAITLQSDGTVWTGIIQ